LHWAGAPEIARRLVAAAAAGPQHASAGVAGRGGDDGDTADVVTHP